MKWEPKRRGLVSGSGPVPSCPPPPVSSVMPARHCTTAYYERRIADLEADLDRERTHRRPVPRGHATLLMQLATVLPHHLYVRVYDAFAADSEHVELLRRSNDVLRLTIAQMEGRLTVPAGQVAACCDGTHTRDCTSPCPDPDDVRDHARDRAADGA